MAHLRGVATFSGFARGIGNLLHESNVKSGVVIHLSLQQDNKSPPCTPPPDSSLAALPITSGQPSPRPWFDYRGLPLKWHLPLGVLYDLVSEPGERPWTLTLHYQGYPDVLVAWHNHLSSQASFFNSLKEACYICRGKPPNRVLSNAFNRMIVPMQDTQLCHVVNHLLLP